MYIRITFSWHPFFATNKCTNSSILTYHTIPTIISNTLTTNKLDAQICLHSLIHTLTLSPLPHSHSLSYLTNAHSRTYTHPHATHAHPYTHTPHAHIYTRKQIHAHTNTHTHTHTHAHVRTYANKYTHHMSQQMILGSRWERISRVRVCVNICIEIEN